MTGTNLPWSIWGRPIKPLSLALVVADAFIFLEVSTGQASAASNRGLSAAVGVLAIACATALVLGWVGNREDLSRAGLLLSSTVWVFIGVVAMFSGEWTHAILASAWTIAAGGGYLLEKTDLRWS